LLEELAECRDLTLDGVLHEDPVERPAAFALVSVCLVLAESQEGGPLTGATPNELFSEARSVAQRLGDSSNRAYVEIRRALHHRDLGQLRMAQDCLSAAIEELGEKRAMEPLLLKELGEIQRHLGEWGEALKSLDRAQAGLRDESDGFEPHVATRCELFGARGQVWLDLGLPDFAAVQFERERQQAFDLGDLDLFLASYLHRANLALATENFVALEKLLDEVLQAPWIDSVAASTQDRFKLRLGLGLSEREREGDTGRRSAALVLEEVTAARRVSERELLMARLVLANLALRRGEPQAAATHLAKAQALDGEQEEDPKSRSVSELHLMRLGLEGRLALQRGAPAEDLLSTLDELEQAYTRFLAIWKNTPLLPGGLGFLHFGGRRQILSDLVQLRLSVDEGGNGTAAAFAGILKAQGAGSMARKLASAAPSLAGLRAALGDALLLYYLPAPDQSHLFILHGDELRHELLAGTFEIERLRRAFLGVVSRSPAGLDAVALESRARGIADAGAALSAALLPPSACAVLRRTDQVTISGAGSLGYIPFELLPLQGDGGAARELGLTHDADYWPSIPVAVSRTQALPTESTNTGLLLVADPTVSEGLKAKYEELLPLGLDDEEFGELRDLARGETRLLIGEGATLSALRSELKSKPPAILHITTHGVYDYTRGRPAGLVLAPDGDLDPMLWCGEAEDLAVPALVMLGACGAARGPRRRGGDGLAHLSGAFQLAGARAVIASHADVALGASLALMKVVHRELALGESPASALRQARAELREHAAYGDPFYWGLVHVAGLGQHPIHGRLNGAAQRDEPSSSIEWRWALLVAVALCVPLLIYRRTRRR
jgi:tetratricopeptide (TPR) repeat protein